MGSSISPFLAEIFLNNLEISKISKNIFFKNKVLFWTRFVDDCLCIFNGAEQDLIAFLNFLNSIHQNITFTFESEVNGKLPFLDLLLEIKNNKIEFDIYRKSTTTTSIIPFDSFHAPQYKFSAFHALFHRLFNTPLSDVNFAKEKDTIFYIAHVNGFSRKSIEKIFSRHQDKLNLLVSTSLEPDFEKPKTFYSIPYLGHMSLKIRRIFREYNIGISFSTLSNLKSSHT